MQLLSAVNPSWPIVSGDVMRLLLCCCAQGVGVFDMPLLVPVPMHSSVPTLVLQGVRLARVEIV
eukprot:COSAG02_NODE_1088_length_14670_cov_237.088326_15_plen_64_part_00